LTDFENAALSSPPMRPPSPAFVSRIVALVLVLGAAEATRARADEPGERAEALLVGTAVNRFVAKQLPVPLRLRGQRAAGIAPIDVTLVEARYCGAIDAGHGRLLGLLRPGAEPPAGAALLTGARDCQDKLDDVLQRIPAGTDGVALVEVVAEWVPSQLRLLLGNAAASGPNAQALGAALARTKAAGPLETLDTSGIRLATERGAALDLDLAISFVKAGDAVVATFTVATPGGRPREPRPTFLDPAAAPAGADAIAGATFPFAQRVVTLYGQDGPLVLPLEGESVEVRELRIWGKEGQLAVGGRATSRAMKESQRLVIEATGPDLKIGEVRSEPELEDCGAATTLAAVGCRARNAARTAAAAAVAAAMTARYRGQLLRALLTPPPYAFDIGGRHLTLRIVPLRARASATGLVVYGHGELE
jgi:hypothetical protein